MKINNTTDEKIEAEMIPLKDNNVCKKLKWILAFFVLVIIVFIASNVVLQQDVYSSKCFKLYLSSPQEEAMFPSSVEFAPVHIEMKEEGNSKFCKIWIRNVNYMYEWMAYTGDIELLDKYGAKIDVINIPFSKLNKGDTIAIEMPYYDDLCKTKAKMKFYTSKNITNFAEELEKLKQKYPVNNMKNCDNYEDWGENRECLAMFILEANIEHRKLLNKAGNIVNKQDASKDHASKLTSEQQKEIDSLEQQNNKYW